MARRPKRKPAKHAAAKSRIVAPRRPLKAKRHAVKVSKPKHSRTRQPKRKRISKTRQTRSEYAVTVDYKKRGKSERSLSLQFSVNGPAHASTTAVQNAILYKAHEGEDKKGWSVAFVEWTRGRTTHHTGDESDFTRVIDAGRITVDTNRNSEGDDE